MSELKTILRSASKIVFVIMALASIAALFTGKISGEQFMVLTSMSFSYYFSRRRYQNNLENNNKTE